MEKDLLAKKRVLIVGDSMLDKYWFGDANRISPEAPVPVVRIVRSDERLGGAANVALNVASLGVRTTLMGVVGNDENGRKLRELLDKTALPVKFFPVFFRTFPRLSEPLTFLSCQTTAKAVWKTFKA